MTFTWFDPDAIRADFEDSLTSFFYPAEFSADLTYAPESLVRFENQVYRTPSESTLIPPPNMPWVRESRALRPIYENVDTLMDPFGGFKVSIDWRNTSNESVGCINGTLRSIEGVLICWIFSPKSSGTSAGLKDGARLRRLLGLWRLASDWGCQVRAYAATGPRSYDLPKGSDFFAHVVTASLTAMERVPTLQVVPHEPIVTVLDGDFL